MHSAANLVWSPNIRAARALIVSLTLLALSLCGGITASFAQDGAKGGDSPAPREAELIASLQAAQKAALGGPAPIPLIDQGQLRLPEGYVFIPRLEATRLMRALGNNPGPNLLGIVVSAKDGLEWLSVLTYNGVGYVKDDEAKNWNADELMSQLRDGTEAGNEQRVARGFKPIEVAGWIEKPVYAEDTHRLVWSALVRDKGAQANAAASVNYNTYALGREGYLQLNLITGQDRIEGDKPHARTLLAALDYSVGKRYEDFDASKDKVAEYGLAALIAGAAAKKIGFFAALLAILAKSWKLAALGIFGIGALISRLFGRNQT